MPIWAVVVHADKQAIIIFSAFLCPNRFFWVFWAKSCFPCEQNSLGASLPTVFWCFSSTNFFISLHHLLTFAALPLLHLQWNIKTTLLTACWRPHHLPITIPCAHHLTKNAIAALSSSDNDKESDMLAINKTQVTQNHMTPRKMGYPSCIDKLHDNQQSHNHNNNCTSQWEKPTCHDKNNSNIKTMTMTTHRRDQRKT